MIPPIITKKLSQKALREAGKDLVGDFLAFTQYDSKTKQYTVYLPHKAPTKTRLHELAHCFLKHMRKFPLTVGEYIATEIEAEEWAYNKCGKALPFEAIMPIIGDAITFGERHSFVFNTTIKALARHNYKLTKQQRSELWWQCREFEDERKRE